MSANAITAITAILVLVLGGLAGYGMFRRGEQIQAEREFCWERGGNYGRQEADIGYCTIDGVEYDIGRLRLND